MDSSPPEYRPDPDLIGALQAQRAAFASDPLPSAETRVRWLKRLRAAVVDEQQALIDAVNSDFGNRSQDETLFAEILPTLQSIDHACKHLRNWMKPSKRRLGIAFQPGSAQVFYQPLGVVGVIVPWNYPIFLSMGPLVGALAADLADHAPGIVVVGDVGGVLGEKVAHDLVDGVVALLAQSVVNGAKDSTHILLFIAGDGKLDGVVTCHVIDLLCILTLL